VRWDSVGLNREVRVEHVVAREVIINATPDVVWASLTSAEEVAQWFGDTATIDLRVGGQVQFTWPAGELSRGVVTVVEPGSRFAFRWDIFGTLTDPTLFTVVEFQLAAVPDGTVLRVTETGLPAVAAAHGEDDLDDLIEEHVDGWRNEISDLVRYVESRPIDVRPTSPNRRTSA
jgi:uncharacterized protein YndB with AHSA1/START domain